MKIKKYINQVKQRKIKLKYTKKIARMDRKVLKKFKKSAKNMTQNNVVLEIFYIQ